MEAPRSPQPLALIERSKSQNEACQTGSGPHSRYWRWFSRNMVLEWRALRRPVVFLLLVAGAIMQYLHNVAHNYVYYLAGHYKVYTDASHKRLIDFGFQLFDSYLADKSFLPSNGLLYGLAGAAAIVVFAPLFTNKIIRSRSIRTVQIIWRAVIVCSICIVFRVCSFLVTILPSPAPQCTKAEFNPPKTIGDIFTNFDTENGCSDLIFSSHVMYGLIAALVVSHYLMMDIAKLARAGIKLPDYELPLKYCAIALVWCAVIAEALCIIAEDRHYSVDVWTAFYAVPLTWIAFYHFFPHDPKMSLSSDPHSPVSRSIINMV